ncbi:phage tail sheath subtilisin-like domain-containing protein [Brevibacillus fulvus]|uniref:Phage tail sheath protein n=1 Tax=Brevibacillus fulvus TaxID=1125967 RepID=A0A938Y4P1_9BACL|nr:phage tail sheath subtilisin-like domain-containing protein [Brevibacillus fulvus]MBM7591175.1 hypothetical protein [Brevibacillus fulvus]
MAGTYIEGSSKVLSGVYTLIRSAINAVSLGARGIVAYPFTSNWGPVNSLQPVLYGSEFDKKYNADKTTLTAKKITTHAFKGKPAMLLAYRMATSAAAKGTLTLKDSSNADSILLTTKYESDRPFQAVVKDSLTAGKVIEIVENSVKLASVEGATVADLVAKLSATDYVDAVKKGDQLPANNAGANFTGGNNGSTVTVNEYQAFLTEVEADGRANSFALDAVTDEAILTVAETWTKRVRTEGTYITWVRGGNWANLDAANTKSKALNHRGIVNVGNGCDGYTAAEMAIFVAARVASVGLNRTVTDEVVDYAGVNKKLTPGERVTAKEAGTLVFTMEGDAVVIDEGVNTLTNPSTDEVRDMGKIRVNNTLDQIARDLEKFGNEYKKTKSNTQQAREAYATTVEETYFKPLAALEVIQPGYYYRPDPQYHGDTAVFHPKIDEAFFDSGVQPVDSMEKIYQKINVNF